MLADEDLEPGPEAARRRHEKQEKQAGEDQFDLQRRAPIPAEIADDVAGARDGKQEHAGNEQRRRMEYGAARKMHLDRPTRVSRSGDGNERQYERRRDATRHPDVEIDAREQHRVRIEKQVIAEYAGERETQRLYR